VPQGYILNTGEVWLVVVYPFSEDESSILECMLESCAVVSHMFFFICTLVIVKHLVLTQIQFNLDEDTRYFITVNAMLRTVYLLFFLHFS
jgi:hypothetical protein